ncbi:hypothetical protein D8Y22_02130 [Salinadaptatus halalkaliphilus]|uniref:DUF8139 domain-containing protein n=1 Tax=Salinadaptatus halalkaliphilus TaxID=2419781 RepID=A0A4V3VLQ0_9EURY|nr:hypothetical protein [Salinadaptatus halalkaliphilus]THE66477.1 hypothetical protein D8Y22_02130 [Salinadaptatus halalkaliphilus]
MQRFSTGDRVRIDIPDETDPDHEQYHGEHGQIVRVLSDDAGSVTDDTRDSRLYRVALDSGDEADFRWRDLRPPINGSPKS